MPSNHWSCILPFFLKDCLIVPSSFMPHCTANILALGKQVAISALTFSYLVFFVIQVKNSLAPLYAFFPLNSFKIIGWISMVMPFRISAIQRPQISSSSVCTNQPLCISGYHSFREKLSSLISSNTSDPVTNFLIKSASTVLVIKQESSLFSCLQ